MDWINATDGIPGVQITVHSSTGQISADHDHCIPVYLRLELRDHYSASLFQGVGLPCKISATIWETTIDVQDLEIFRDCIAWKAKDRLEKWEAHERFLKEL